MQSDSGEIGSTTHNSRSKDLEVRGLDPSQFLLCKVDFPRTKGGLRFSRPGILSCVDSYCMSWPRAAGTVNLPSLLFADGTACRLPFSELWAIRPLLPHVRAGRLRTRLEARGAGDITAVL